MYWQEWGQIGNGYKKEAMQDDLETSSDQISITPRCPFVSPSCIRKRLHWVSLDEFTLLLFFSGRNRVGSTYSPGFKTVFCLFVCLL